MGRSIETTGIETTGPIEGVDWGRTSKDYATHRQGFPPELFARLAALGIGLPGARALDLGTGTGTLARGLAARGARVVAIDVSPGQIAAAKGLDPGGAVDFRVGAAEATGLPDGELDLVIAGQCWHWFERDRAAREARRLLAPGGALVIAHFDYLERPGNIVARTEAALFGATGTREMPHAALGVHGLYPAWIPDVEGAGLALQETFSFEAPALYSTAGWLGRMRAGAYCARLDADGIARFEARYMAEVEPGFPVEFEVPHRVFALVARSS